MAESRAKDFPPFRVHQKLVGSLQLIVNMSLLKAAHGVADDAEFERRFGIRDRRVAQFRDDGWVDVSRVELQTLLNLERQLGDGGLEYSFLSLVAHPFWEDFKTLTNGYPGTDEHGAGLAVDAEVLAALAKAGVPIKPNANPDVAQAIGTQNCIFVGAPIHNNRTDAALRLLFPSGPPFRFQRTQADWGEVDTPYKAVGDTKGLLHPSEAGKFYEDRSQKTHGKRKKPLPPSGALVVCRRPLRARNDVTTMIIAGCSVLGTAQIAQDLLDGAVFVRPNSLEAGKPRVFILAPRGDGGTQWLAPS